jgi:hypothetical protein
MNGSYLLTKGWAATAANRVFELFSRFPTKRKVLAIVIMDPGKPFGSGVTFEDAILCKLSYGKPPVKYTLIALEKAEVTWRTGLPSHVVQQQAPHLLKAHNTKWGGSAIHEGIVVACSGVEWYLDQLFSQIIAATCAALVIGEMENVMVSNAAFMLDYKKE